MRRWISLCRRAGGLVVLFRLSRIADAFLCAAGGSGFLAGVALGSFACSGTEITLRCGDDVRAHICGRFHAGQVCCRLDHFMFAVGEANTGDVGGGVGAEWSSSSCHSRNLPPTLNVLHLHQRVASRACRRGDRWRELTADDTDAPRTEESVRGAKREASMVSERSTRRETSGGTWQVHPASSPNGECPWQGS